VVWFQGCTLGCPGCFNPATHGDGPESDVADVIAQLRAARDIEGISLSGGRSICREVHSSIGESSATEAQRAGPFHGRNDRVSSSSPARESVIGSNDRRMVSSRNRSPS